MADLSKNPFAHKAHEYQRHGRGEADPALVQREVEQLKAEGDPYMKDVDVSELTNWDIVTWMLFRGGSLDLRSFAQRRKNALEGHDPNARDSRTMFYGFIGNKMAESVAQEQIKELERK